MTTGRINQVASLLREGSNRKRSESREWTRIPPVEGENAGPAATAEPRVSKAHGREYESRSVLKRFETHDVPAGVNARGFAHVVVERFLRRTHGQKTLRSTAIPHCATTTRGRAAGGHAVKATQGAVRREPIVGGTSTRFLAFRVPRARRARLARLLRRKNI